MEPNQDFVPRDYQVELMEIGLKKNTIIYLPTGSGKTFIALMILKRMSGDLLKPYSLGGKLSIILVNTIALVDQHAKYIQNHTNLRVGKYSGDMKLDFWPREKWYEEYDKHQVLIMTCQILVNNVVSNYINLNNINLLIFDECHRGVQDHSMRQLMKAFENVTNAPRVIGLTATLLNGNCKPARVMEQVTALEVTYHSKVATVDGLSSVIGYATNPREFFKVCETYSPNEIEFTAVAILNKVMQLTEVIKVESKPLVVPVGHKPLDGQQASLRKLKNLLQNLSDHIVSMGTFGGMYTVIAYMIQIERLKRKCLDEKILCLLNYVETSLSFIKQLLENILSHYPVEEQAFRCSSDKMLKLFEILKEYKSNSKEELCGIVFTQQRFTAKILYFVLSKLSEINPNYSHVKPDYMVGFNSNPYNNTREEMYSLKKNKQVLKRFEDKEINLIVASNVLEEGVDIPKCSLVIKYDKPLDYRSYIQSKGRARHKESLYYMLVEAEHLNSFKVKYSEYQQVEEILNNYLVGKNQEREEPSPEDIEKMYREYELPPYYADGPGSAQVNMGTAIPLLCHYCSLLPADIYTVYNPEWYAKKQKKFLQLTDQLIECTSVTVVLPTICPITEPIEGPYMPSIKSAKRAAALQACIKLHKIGELDNHLLPRKIAIAEEDVGFLFQHYPKVKEPFAGNSKNKRLHSKKVSKYLKGTMTSGTFYLHIIELEPFFPQSYDINDSTMYDSYASPLCFGILTLNPLPSLCDFPMYATLGTLNVKLKVNQGEVFLDDTDLFFVRQFHHTIFNDILKITSLAFLVLDNSNEAEVLLVVPVDKRTSKIDMVTLKQFNEVKEVIPLSTEEKLDLEVTQETHLRKIVCPWHRETVPYVVTEVCLNRSSLSPFPNESFSDYVEYFETKYNQCLMNPNLPLLLVKGITKKLNFIKPVGQEAKRKRDKVFEETTEHLPPELVIKQDFPSSLWIQARFLPTVLSRVSFMLQIEELRRKIAKESGLGKEQMPHQPALTLDEYLLKYKPFLIEERLVINEDLQVDMDLSAPPTVLHFNKEFAAKLLEAEFPWKDIDEPKDIERTLDVSIMDIEHFERFVNEPIDSKKAVLRNDSPKRLALTYEKDFVHKPVRLLEKTFSAQGPSISDLYRALTAAKGNDIVNLERLETLGDTFLKWIVSFYVYIRFPKYDEGRHTQLKGRLVSNKNLYYLADKKDLGGIMKYNELSPADEWLPPTYTIPQEMLNKIKNKEVSINALFNLETDTEEQISGYLKAENIRKVQEVVHPPDETEVKSYGSMACFLKSQYIGDKHVADVVESLLGAYFLSCGFEGGIKFIEWMGIIPKSERLNELLASRPPNPVLNANSNYQDIMTHLPQWRDIEKIMGYNFKNHAYLLQALTHSSYSLNRITLSYEKLEFLGDAVLDFLITCYIYESCGTLNPGQLTDLRSALVNNNTFAGIIVRLGLHKHLLMMNFTLQVYIDRFDEFMKGKHYQIDNEVLILLDENELHLAEYVDVPKVLGDLFEALIGAVYLDCGKDFNTVWKVIYKMMWKEIDLFSQNVPINVIRRLFETPDIEPKFGTSVMTNNGRCIVPLRFLLQGKPKFVHGCGMNKIMAKRAAAKLALRTLEI